LCQAAVQKVSISTEGEGALFGEPILEVKRGVRGKKKREGKEQVTTTSIVLCGERESEHDQQSSFKEKRREEGTR